MERGEGVWATRFERPKCTKGEVKRPETPPARTLSRGQAPEVPLEFQHNHHDDEQHLKHHREGNPGAGLSLRPTDDQKKPTHPSFTVHCVLEECIAAMHCVLKVCIAAMH